MARKSKPKIEVNQENAILDEVTFAIVCEGMDAKNFMIGFLGSIFRDLPEKMQKTIRCFDGGGINEFREFALKQAEQVPGFDHLSHWLLIRDAEKDAQAAKAQIDGILEKVQISVPGPAVWSAPNDAGLHAGYLLFPTCSPELCPGTLEDLLWDILCESVNGLPPKDWMRNQAQSYVNEVTKHPGGNLKWPHKSRLHALLSVYGREHCGEFVGKKIGEAARDHAFDWSNTRLDPMRSMIQEAIGMPGPS